MTYTSSPDNSDASPTSLASVGALALNEALYALRRAGYRIVKLRKIAAVDVWQDVEYGSPGYILYDVSGELT